MDAFRCAAESLPDVFAHNPELLVRSVEHNISGCEKARDERGGEDDRLSRRVDSRLLVTEWNPRLSTRATDVLMVHDVVWRFM